MDRDLNQQVFRVRFGVFDFDITVFILVEDPRVNQFVFLLVTRPCLVGVNKIIIGKGIERVLIEITHVGMRWR